MNVKLANKGLCVRDLIDSIHQCNRMSRMSVHLYFIQSDNA
jgi:hypothetical protein